MPLKFGTSGVRGLVTEMTDLQCYLFARAFVQYARSGSAFESVALAGDLRPSTGRILEAVARGIVDEGAAVEICGRIGSPVLANFAFARSLPSIMVTGSHIPADRNGIKFNLPQGEVLKEDESGILDRYRALQGATSGVPSHFGANEELLSSARIPLLEENIAPVEEYVERFVSFFPSDVLAGLKVLVYQHSSVSRDLLVRVLEELGGEALCRGRSGSFVPVDTEAVENLPELSRWIDESEADALLSTDGDGDRPLLVDDLGRQVRGDFLGALVAESLAIDGLAIPVSCSSVAEKMGCFGTILRTRIGSPYVIAGMQQLVQDRCDRVAGYEANGGFLSATPLSGDRETLSPLPTRDAFLPLLGLLCRCATEGRRVSELVDSLPPVFNYSGVLRRFPLDLGHSIIELFRVESLKAAEEYFGAGFGKPVSIDFTDGARIEFAGGEIVHLRPSGNAPEFRCYTETADEERAVAINDEALEIVANRIRPDVE